MANIKWAARRPGPDDSKSRLGADPQLLFLSAASGWEIAIKAQLGKLRVHDELERFLAEQLSMNQISALPITMYHALHVQRLPLHHSDPFDRMLIAQSQLEAMPIMTMDSIFSRYHVETIW